MPKTINKSVINFDLQPATMSVADAIRYTSLGRTTVFKFLRSKAWASVASGRRRLIYKASIDNYLAMCADGEPDSPPLAAN